MADVVNVLSREGLSQVTVADGIAWDQPAPSQPREPRWDRPLVVPLGGGEPIAYQRISTFAGLLDDGYAIGRWRGRHIARGIGAREDLAAIAAGCEEDQALLDEVVEKAIDFSGGNSAAHYGTAVHRWTEPNVDRGLVPERMRDDVDSFTASLDRYGISVVATEEFVVADEFEGRALQVAGTFDGLAEVPALDEFLGRNVALDGPGRYVFDKKTGALHHLPVAIQLASYALGVRYHWDPVTREDLRISQDLALVAHVPKGKGRTVWFVVDLRRARDFVRLALAVRDARKERDHVAPLEEFLAGPAWAPAPYREVVAGTEDVELPGTQEFDLAPNGDLPGEELADLVARAGSVDEIAALYQANRDSWEAVRDVARARRAILEGGLGR